MDLLFHRFVLSSGRLLRHYLSEGAPTVPRALDLMFLDEREQDATRPDHLYKSTREQDFAGVGTLRGLLRTTFRRLSEDYVEFRHTRAGIKPGRFGSWQRLITRVPTVPLVTYALRHEFGWWDKGPAHRYITANHGRSTLPTVFCPAIEEMVESEGLSDLHVHLNGTTEADSVWQDALHRPRAVCRELEKGFRTQALQSVREQYDQIEEGLNPTSIRRRLRLARYLRFALTEHLFAGRPLELDGLDLRIESRFITFDDSRFTHRTHPAQPYLGSVGDDADTQYEAHFLWRAFDALEDSDRGERIAPPLHLYLLLAAQFTRFLVQQTDQKGFDQFQKITVNEFRTLSEQDYRRRYHQLARTDRCDLVFLEGRFAPADTVPDNWKRLHGILKGYQLFQGGAAKKPLSPHTDAVAGPIRLELGLVVHFIKEAEKTGYDGDGRPQPRGLCRHEALRRRSQRKAVSLLALHRRARLVQRYLVGVDAASNELHAPPEVFAPVFQRFRRHGFTHFTYHAGEDFRHLLSGMRAVVEAVEFLDLRRGNRIGHATALGLDPALWWRRMGGRIVLARGEWLDNLVFAYAVLAEARLMTDRLMALRDRIGREARRLYGDADGRLSLTPDDLAAAWRLRGLDPLLALDPSREHEPALDLARRQAWEKIRDARTDQAPAFRLFRAYHSQPVRARWDEPLATTEADADAALLAAVQRAALARIVKTGIVLESMPTSNVRISVYQDHQEHHILRWLGLEGDLPQPEVVLGSDDPGIFANALRNEFIHLHEVLRSRPDLDERRVMDTLRTLNRNGRIHRFRSPPEETADRPA